MVQEDGGSLLSLPEAGPKWPPSPFIFCDSIFISMLRTFLQVLKGKHHLIQFFLAETTVTWGCL